jgi:predicted HTH domain antitoxin
MAETIQISIEGIEDADACRAAAERAREAGILELYRLGQISSGRAASNLGLSRAEFLDLASRHRIPTIQITADELEKELGSLER